MNKETLVLIWFFIGWLISGLLLCAVGEYMTQKHYIKNECGEYIKK
jgi:hypothetical protein